MKVRPDPGGPLVEVEYSLRNGLMRAESKPADTASVLIADPSTKTLYQLIPQRRMYVAWPLAVDGSPSSAHPDVVRTGRKETIAAYECEHWLVKDPMGELSVCVTTGLDAFTVSGPGEPRWSAFMRAQRGFPLKASKVGGELVMEATKIEPKPLDAALFRVPADYTEMNFFTGGPRQP